VIEFTGCLLKQHRRYLRRLYVVQVTLSVCATSICVDATAVTLSPQGREIPKKGNFSLSVKNWGPAPLVTSPTMYAIKPRKRKDPVDNVSTIQSIYAAKPMRVQT